ncbi:MAG: hypothetical protein LBC82_09820 [Oscillospiraceae bacterium]|jgi:hypothetical protein|nr:hypothetical protein [Oscillospiraceae bacterium]
MKNLKRKYLQLLLCLTLVISMFSGIFPGVQQIVVQAAQIYPDHLVWRLVSFSGSNGSPASRHAVFEIYNPTNRRIELDGYSISYQDTNHNWIWNLPTNATVLPGGSFLIRGANNNGDGRWDNRNTPFDLQTPPQNQNGLRSSNSSNQLHLYDPMGIIVSSAISNSSNNDDVLYNHTLKADTYIIERRGVGSDAGGMNRIPRTLSNGSWGAYNPIVKSELISLISLAEQENETDWGITDWSDLMSALAEAIFVRDTNNVTLADQTDVDLASEQLIDLLALNNPYFINKSSLTKAIEQAQVLKYGDYTLSSWAVMTGALSSAIEVEDDGMATQIEINAAKNALNTAIAALVRVLPFSIPDTEVKFLLDPALVLDSNGNLLSSVSNLFGGLGRDRGRSVTMQFMDTPDRDFNNEGWINRIRCRPWNQPGEGYQITYRKRIPIETVNYATIKEAIDNAYADGFGNWEMTIDWSYDSAVLTLSHTVETGGSASNSLPNVATSKNLLKNNLSGNMSNLYGTELIAAFDDVIIYGAVQFRRYEFNFPGTSERILRIEVMPILTACGTGMEYIVEASFEFENEGRFDFISERRTQIQNTLENAGILLPESGLRTTKVLERYGQ